MKKVFGWLLCSVLLIACNSDSKTTEGTETKAGSDVAATTPGDYEIGDAKFVDIAKNHTGYLTSGDIDSWMKDFSDDAIYRWNYLDSLTGKAAITDYWKKRRTDVIDSMAFSGDIWMPVKVNKSQAPGHLTGNYVLSWYTINVKYKTGKSMKQKIHTVYHFNADNKIDRFYQYLDRVPIIAAMAK
jgi:hypothetical protein